MTDKTTIQEGTLSSDAVMAQLRERLSKVNSTVSQQEVSAVTEVADGIARVAGLRSAMAGELLEFTSSVTGHSVFGLAQNLDETSVGAVLFGEVSEIKATSVALLAVLWTSLLDTTCLVVLLTHWASLLMVLALSTLHIAVLLSSRLLASCSVSLFASQFRLDFWQLTLWFLSAVVSVS